MPAPSFTIEELPDSPREVWSRQSGFAPVRRFKVPWASRYAFKDLITGMGSYPGFPSVLPDQVECVPFGNKPIPRDTSENMDPTAFLNSYESAIFTVTWRSPSAGQTTEEEDQPDGTRISIGRESTGEFMTIPARGMVWPSTGKRLPPDAHPVMVISITRWRIRWAGIVRPPWTAIENMKGKVNEEAYAIPVIGLSAPPETLLFEGATQQVDSQFGAKPEMTLEYSFQQKQIFSLGGTETYGWNHAFNPETGLWEKPTAATDIGTPIEGAFMYKAGNPATLFQQGGP